MKNRKGIILAGGNGTRLHPLTKIISKQLLPVYDKPMIFYPLTTLMSANIREILIITTPHDNAIFKKLLGNGSDLGINISYEIQEEPKGIAQSLIIAEKFIDQSPSALILGDNIFYGIGIENVLLAQSSIHNGASIFIYPVKDPSRYGVAEINENNLILNIEEKPIIPKSPYAVTGLYFFDKKAPEIAKKLIPSERGELEITDLNKVYLNNKELKCIKLDKNFTWLDSGTFESLREANNFVFEIQKKQQRLFGCPEEIAFLNGWIDEKILEKKIQKNQNSYGKFLKKIMGSDYESKIT